MFGIDFGPICTASASNTIGTALALLAAELCAASAALPPYVVEAGRWVWNHLNTIGGVLLIPWGMFGVSIAGTGWKKFVESSGADIFVILASLDFEFIVFQNHFIHFVYGGIQPKFAIVFGFGCLVSIAMLVWSSRVQRRISDCGDTRDTSYPVVSAIFCWTVALTWMAAHFFAILAT